MIVYYAVFFFFKQKTAYEMRISDWSSDVCSSDLLQDARTAFFRLIIEDQPPSVGKAGLARAAFQRNELSHRAARPNLEGVGAAVEDGAHLHVALEAARRLKVVWLPVQEAENRVIGRLFDKDRKSTRLNSSH